MPKLENRSVIATLHRQPTEVDRFVGKKIELLRRSAGITQTELGRQIEMSDKQLRKYLIGENRVSASVLYRISLALKVPVDAFFDGVEAVIDDRGRVPIVPITRPGTRGLTNKHVSKHTMPPMLPIEVPPGFEIEEIKELVAAYYKLPTNRQIALKRVINAIADTGERAQA